jgi:hypothetical protein
MLEKIKYMSLGQKKTRIAILCEVILEDYTKKMKCKQKPEKVTDISDLYRGRTF